MRDEQVRITVAKVTRRDRSVSGNPKKVLHSDTGQEYVTKTDAMCAHAISDEWRDQPVILTLNARGEVIHVAPVEPHRWRA